MATVLLISKCWSFFTVIETVGQSMPVNAFSSYCNLSSAMQTDRIIRNATPSEMTLCLKIRAIKNVCNKVYKGIKRSKFNVKISVNIF